MIGASKILTVSYGTFSCTLEGFDEPFNTMKAIAEYFRDLSADDRYFGAEPPTPDATMLHRIAERAVNRRVEARIEDNSVILRTGDAMQGPAAAPAAPVQTMPEAPPRPAPAGLLAEESVAAKLQRIRAAVARSARPAEDAILADDEDAAPVFVAPLAHAAPAQVKDAIAPQADWSAAEPEAEPETSSGAPEPLVQTEADPAPVILASIALAADAEEDGADVAPEPIDGGTLVRDARSEDSAAASLSSAQAEATDADQDDAADLVPLNAVIDMPAPGAAAAADTADTPHEGRPGASDEVLVLSTVFPEELQDEAPEDLPEVTTEDLPESAAAEDDAFLASIAFAAPEDPEDHVTFDDSFEEDIPEEAAAAPTPAWDDQRPEDDSDPESTEEWDATAFPAAEKDAYELFAERSGTEASDDAWPADPDLPEPAVAAAEPDAASDKLRRARQRVLVVRAPESAAAASTAADSATTAAMEGEEESDADGTQKAEGRAILEDNAKEAEDVTRLLRQTNTEMDEPENRRRLSTMAHLKAAVAATVADLRSAGGGNRTGEATRLDRYRADLARVVRPRRPDGSTPTERPAPLVLVSEQRIDRPAADGASNRVVPRRISTTNLAIDDVAEDSDAPAETDNIFAASRNFAEFAEHLGASDMPDLLEAAAAYTSCIEGRPHFTRPHLMRHVAAATEVSDANREDSMRSFGTLLRQGKIAKVKRGQFAITDSSYYLAEARRMTR